MPARPDRLEPLELPQAIDQLLAVAPSDAGGADRRARPLEWLGAVLVRGVRRSKGVS